MPLGLSNLDPTVAAAFAESLHADSLKEKREERSALHAALKKQRWVGAGWIGFVPVGAAFASCLLGAQLVNQPWLMGGLFGFSFLCSSASLWHTSRRDLLVGFQTNLPSEVLLAALPLMTLSSAESLYGKAVALLAALQAEIGEQTTQSILLQLNELLTNHRDLEIQCQRLTEAVAQHSVATLGMERDRFLQRLQETEDSVTRQSLQQSLQMCMSRLEDTQAMEQNQQRVVAQQEAIAQTFASVQSSLMRMQTTPSLAPPAVEEIVQSVRQISLQTQAVEGAVKKWRAYLSARACACPARAHAGSSPRGA